MSATYEIEVIHADRGAWLDDLREAVAAELLTVGLHRSVSVVVTEAAASRDLPAVAIVLGSAVAASSPDVDARSQSAITDGLVVLPVVSDLSTFQQETPPSLRHLNGHAFAGDEAARDLARILLRELEIEDRELRVFVSHRREDGLWAAEQLHDELSHRSFRPFIDRFAIRPAGNVQSEIADALEDHAFLLLLETPLAHTSPWVFDEVDYALAHTMATVIVRWPGEVQNVPGSAGLPRLTLEESDLIRDDQRGDLLTEAAVERVIAAVEAAHAYGLVRRRRQLVCSIEDAAVASGASATPLPGWRLLVESADRSFVVGITPRLPTAADLQRLDIARGDHGPATEGLLVHAARALRPERADHLAWVLTNRQLELLAENAVGGRWT